MRTDFTPEFSSEKDKKANAPVTLMQIDWPAIGSLPALTLRLTDRGSGSDNRRLTINGTDWFALIQETGDLDRLVGAANFSANSVADLKVTLTNLPTGLFTPAQPFSHIFKGRPPEAATVTVYQWFDGLQEPDMAEIFVAAIADPVRFNERTCSFDLVDIGARRGANIVGNLISADDYPQAPESSTGRMKPIVIGEVETAPAILVKEASQTKLISVAAPGDTALTVADNSKFASSGVLKINDDEVAYTGKTATQFTGCSGINEFHYADDAVLEKINDHRYLLSDPEYPLKQITNVKVDGQPANPADYTVDLINGEVVFSKKPERAESLDTKFLQAQFDAVGTGNTAIDPLNAADPDARTSYARISQANGVLSLQQTGTLPNIGVIGKVKLRVEHFVEEKLPSDSVTAEIAGVGQVGTLSPPAADDAVISQGNVDITHSHLDTLGFPITDPTHQHSQPRKTTVFQTATGGLDSGGFPMDSLNPNHTVTFPAAPAGTIDNVVYTLNFEVITPSGSVGQGLVFKTDGINEFTIFTLGSGGANTYTPTGSLGQAPTTVTLAKSLASATVKLFSVTREITLTPVENVDLSSTGASTSKSGAVTPHSSSPALSSTAEKNTSTIVDFFDITSHVNGDWNWFTNREAQIKYNGTSDGRTAFIIHVAFEIEYARRRVTFTDAVTADVQGVRDDAGGSLTGTADGLIERPEHVFQWALIHLLGLTASDVNAVAFSQAGFDFAGAIPGGYKLAGIIQKKIQARDLFRDWEQNCRAYFFWNLGKANIQFRPFNAVTPSFIADKIITADKIRLDRGGRAMLNCERTPNRNIVNTIDLQFRRDWSTEEYHGLHRVTDSDSIGLYGRREKPEAFAFDWTRQSSQAEDLAGFYLAQHREPSDVVEMELFLDHVELERGDLLKISPPTHERTDLPALILGVGRKIGSGRQRRMDSIPVTVQLMHGFVDSQEGGFGTQPFGSSRFGGVEKI